MTAAQTIELKPCPFCGGEAKYDQDEDFCERIVCLGCDAQTVWTHPGRETKELKINEWNTRHAVGGGSCSHSEPTQDELIAIAKRLEDFSEKGVFTAQHRWRTVMDAAAALRAVALSRPQSGGIEKS